VLCALCCVCVYGINNAAKDVRVGVLCCAVLCVCVCTSAMPGMLGNWVCCAVHTPYTLLHTSYTYTVHTLYTHTSFRTPKYRSVKTDSTHCIHLHSPVHTHTHTHAFPFRTPVPVVRRTPRPSGRKSPSKAALRVEGLGLGVRVRVGKIAPSKQHSGQYIGVGVRG
jgi:hypothetical protein